jgi:hypothetical protein
MLKLQLCIRSNFFNKETPPTKPLNPPLLLSASVKGDVKRGALDKTPEDVIPVKLMPLTCMPVELGDINNA